MIVQQQISQLRKLIREQLSLLTEGICPRCGDTNAYIGFHNNVECPNKACPKFSQQQYDDIHGADITTSISTKHIPIIKNPIFVSRSLMPSNVELYNVTTVEYMGHNKAKAAILQFGKILRGRSDLDDYELKHFITKSTNVEGSTHVIFNPPLHNGPDDGQYTIDEFLALPDNSY